MMFGKDSDQILTLDDICEQLSVSRSYAYQLLRSGNLKACKEGRLWRTKQKFLDEYIDNKCNQNNL